MMEVSNWFFFFFNFKYGRGEKKTVIESLHEKAKRVNSLQFEANYVQMTLSSSTYISITVSLSYKTSREDTTYQDL